MKVDIRYSAVPVPIGYRLPAGRTFARLKHDYDLYGLSRPSHNGSSLSTLGLPETIKTLYPVFAPLTRAWQNYWVDGFSYVVFKRPYVKLNRTEVDYIKKAFQGVTVGWRAITNKHGWNNGYADYINAVNTGSPPMEQETINFGGNVVELVNRDKMRLGGYDVYKVRTLNAYQEPPNILEVNYLTTPWLVMQLTNSRRDKILNEKGEWDRKSWIENKVDAFPQLGGAPVPAPFLGKGLFNYIRAERIEILEESALVPPVYV